MGSLFVLLASWALLTFGAADASVLYRGKLAPRSKAHLSVLTCLRGGESCDHSGYTVEDSGEPNTLEFRRYLLENGNRISLWHDIALRAPGGGYHAVIEIPKDTTAKMEIATDESWSPIKQDTKKGKLRDYNMPIHWNYGALPQTWERPDHEWAGLVGHRGDNDPVDVVDLGCISCTSGSVIEVKPVAALAMIDEGEVDWKVLCINVADPKASLVHSLEDVEIHFPGQIAAVRTWFTWYKARTGTGESIPGKEPNVFGFGGQPLDAKATEQVIADAHSTWQDLVQQVVDSNGLALPPS